MLRVARNAFNIGEVWNPVCCHGNKIVKLKLWSTFSRILLQRIKHLWYKVAETLMLHQGAHIQPPTWAPYGRVNLKSVKSVKNSSKIQSQVKWQVTSRMTLCPATTRKPEEFLQEAAVFISVRTVCCVISSAARNEVLVMVFLNSWFPSRWSMKFCLMYITMSPKQRRACQKNCCIIGLVHTELSRSRLLIIIVCVLKNNKKVTFAVHANRMKPFVDHALRPIEPSSNDHPGEPYSDESDIPADSFEPSESNNHNSGTSVTIETDTRTQFARAARCPRSTKGR